jgi:histidine ammonia-lyase
MTISLTGSDLTIEDVVAVARDRDDAALDQGARETMERAHRVVESAFARGDTVYGLTTGVGVLKRVTLGGSPEEVAAFNRSLVERHRAGQGPAAPPDVVRAAIVCMANTLARGYAGVRPALVERLLGLLDSAEGPTVRLLGSTGQADLTANADLASSILDDFTLAPGEGLALLNNNAFSVAWAALALADVGRLLDSMEASAALALEGFAANLSPLHAAVAAARPYEGLSGSLTALRTHLDGSSLHGPGAARNLQDPLTFRNAAPILGAARDALGFARRQIGVELNAAQGNPLIVASEERVISVANFEALPIAAAMDALRIALAPAVGAAAERSVKLLETPWSGLPTGLTPRPGTADMGLSMFGVAVQSIAAEARSLAAPVSLDLVSTSQAEGIEDRTTMAPLAARRTVEMAGLADRVAAIELVVAAQAMDLRGSAPWGRGTTRIHGSVREVVPFMDAGSPVPDDLEPVVALVRSGRLAAT